MGKLADIWKQVTCEQDAISPLPRTSVPGVDLSGHGALTRSGAFALGSAT
jgi:hypothetical protein